jgi:hypothetical protein
MEKGRYAQYGAATGIVAVILIIVGFSIFGSGIPDTDASAKQWQSFFVDHQNRIQTAITLVGVGAFFYIWFLGSLRDALGFRWTASPLLRPARWPAVGPT